MVNIYKKCRQSDAQTGMQCQDLTPPPLLLGQHCPGPGRPVLAILQLCPAYQAKNSLHTNMHAIKASSWLAGLNTSLHTNVHTMRLFPHLQASMTVSSRALLAVPPSSTLSRLLTTPYLPPFSSASKLTSPDVRMGLPCTAALETNQDGRPSAQQQATTFEVFSSTYQQGLKEAAALQQAVE